MGAKKVVGIIGIVFLGFIILAGIGSTMTPEPRPTPERESILDPEFKKMLDQSREKSNELWSDEEWKTNSDLWSDKYDTGCSYGYWMTPAGCCSVEEAYNPETGRCFYVPNLQEKFEAYQREGGGSGGYTGGSSGGSCGGWGSVYVTKPIYIAQGSVKIGNTYGGMLEMDIPVRAGTYSVDVQAFNFEGDVRNMRWNTNVVDCQQSLIRWN